MVDIQIGFPGEDDWQWILDKHAETAWASLPAGLQNEVSVQTVRDSLAGQTEGHLAGHGDNNQVFVARTPEDGLVGYLWVAEIKSGFTGEKQAYILNIYITEKSRGQGIGEQLMRQADAWALGRGYKRVGLGVSIRNSSAIRLYEKLGYEMETMRMFKNLNAGT